MVSCLLPSASFLLICSFPLLSIAGQIEDAFRNPPQEFRPWVFWYWMNAAVSKEGITADLESMKQGGISGAYLCFIKREANPALTGKPIVQLTPEWWDHVGHALREADRLDLKLAFHMSDGFATAGGPWITPELSMQKLTWSETDVDGGRAGELKLPTPPHLEGYYRDVAVLAFPASRNGGAFISRKTPKISVSIPDAEVDFLAGGGRSGTFRSESKCWIQYSYDTPFTARALRVSPAVNNFQSLRPRVEASNDGVTFTEIARIEPPRHGWRDFDEPHTFALPPTTALHFRFYFDKEGSEPGSENLEAAKWSPVLKLRRLELSESARIDAYEGKTGLVWRVGRETTELEAAAGGCIPRKDIVTLQLPEGSDGRLRCELPAGKWTILRIGTTSTGRKNDTAGGGLGLECDKFNPAAVRLQFDRWFGELVKCAGPEIASRTIRIFHVDSWECGSQNWSPVLLEEFKRRRGYDPIPFLPAMAGHIVGGAAESERFLRDMRATFSDLVAENFYGVLAGLVHAKGMQFSSECVAPVMSSDALRPFSKVDIPMGEFWLRSPTHDKPNDMLDAISGAHIYGKRVVQAEAFTQLRMSWNETPALIKPLADRAFSLGINRIVHHVTTHNPWMDRHPGITMGGVGLFFQRDQTWWPMVSAWNQYLSRCQLLLQIGVPVVDLAVFTGEEIPNRALLPSELLDSLPGLFGKEALEREKRRLANLGQPQRELPATIHAGANIADLSTWTDPLRGYAYDSINKDALLNLSGAEDGILALSGDVSYRALVIPGKRPLNPSPVPGSPELNVKLAQLAEARVPMIRADLPGGAFTAESLEAFGIPRDFEAIDTEGKRLENISWAHRYSEGFADIYFVSNQDAAPRAFTAVLRSSYAHAELWDPVSGEITPAFSRATDKHTQVPLQLPAHGSVFVVVRNEAPSRELGAKPGSDTDPKPGLVPSPGVQSPRSWTLQFPGSPAQTLEELRTWTQLPGRDSFSGIATYSSTFTRDSASSGRVWLDLGVVRDMARVRVNGIDCGIAWTAPYRVEITRALTVGANQLEIQVANTWHNQLLADSKKKPGEAKSYVSSPVRTASKTPLDAGLLGPVRFLTE